MGQSITVDLYDYFHLEYEDIKHNLVRIVLNDAVEKWMNENNIDSYDINCDDFYNDGKRILIIEFENDADALAFKLRWI